MVPSGRSETERHVRNERFVRAFLAPMIIAFAVTFGAGIVAINSYPGLSPLDELQHLDYVLRVSNGELVLNPGERVGEDAMRIQACSGIDAPFQSPPCDDPDLQPEEFQELGINTAGKGYPNPYYLVTGALVAGMRAVGLDEFTAARVANLLVHAIGASLVALIAAALSRSAVLGAGLGTLLGVLPHLLSQGATVNPDSWALLAGAVFVGLAVWRHRFRLGVWVLLVALATIGFGLIKPNWVLLVAVPFVAVIARWWADRATVPGRELLAAVGIGVLGVVVLGGSTIWSSSQASEGSKAPMDQYLAISPTNPFDVSRTITTTLRAVVPFDAPPVVDSLSGEVGLGLAFAWGVLLTGAAALAIFACRLGSRAFLLGSAGVLVLGLSPVMVYLGQYLSGLYFEYPQRYSYFALPIIAAALAAWRPARGVLLGVAALLSSVGFVLLGLSAAG